VKTPKKKKNVTKKDCEREEKVIVLAGVREKKMTMEKGRISKIQSEDSLLEGSAR